MSATTVVTDIKQVTVRFSDPVTDVLWERYSQRFRPSSGQIYFPDFPAEIRARKAPFKGIEFQVRIREKDVYNSGDKADVLSP